MRVRRHITARTAIVAAAVVAVGAVAARVLTACALNPFSNAVIALVVFGGMLAAMLVPRRVRRRGDDGVDQPAAVVDHGGSGPAPPR